MIMIIMFDSIWKNKVTLYIVYFVSNILLILSDIVVEYLVGIDLPLENNCMWYNVDEH